MQNSTPRRVSARSSTVNSLTLRASGVVPIQICCQMSAGLPHVHVIGLSARASKDLIARLSAAFASLGVRFPAKKVIFSLTPELLQSREESRAYDLAFAIAFLLAQGHYKQSSKQKLLAFGQLQIDGTVQRPEIFPPLAGDSPELQGFRILSCLDTELTKENQLDIREISHLKDLFFTESATVLRPRQSLPQPSPPDCDTFHELMREFRASPLVLRALAIAAAGGHHLLVVGPPGLGKSMLSQLLHSLLPPLSPTELRELKVVYAAQAEAAPENRPLRQPVLTTSRAGLLGSANLYQAGELALAHTGVLHVEECLEWTRASLESLRQPLETGFVESHGRNRRLPARFVLLATSNLCPCGSRGSEAQLCACSLQDIKRYQQKLSHALLDRIPLQIRLDGGLQPRTQREGSERLLSQVQAAQERMRERQQSMNERTSLEDLRRAVPWDKSAQNLWGEVSETSGLSFRALASIMRVATTIADLEGVPEVRESFVREALFFRRSVWGNSLRSRSPGKHTRQAVEGSLVQ